MGRFQKTSGGLTTGQGDRPLARTDGMVVEEIAGEVLVYDPQNDRAHCLGTTAARVWRACDGIASIDAITASLKLSRSAVEGALEELAGCGLIESGPRQPQSITRRDLTIKVGKVGAAAAAAPFVVSIAVPATAAATPTVEECRAGFTSGCGDCKLSGCCCCGPGGGTVKDCVPTATCGVVDYPLAPAATSSCSKTNP